MRHLAIFENFILQFLLNESIVSFSKDFRNVLVRMKNPIADEILKSEGQDKPVTNNYFDLKPDTNDGVTFITDRKYKEIADKSNYGKYKIKKFDILNPVEKNAPHYAQLDMELPTEVKEIPVGEVGKIDKMWTSPSSEKTWAKFVSDNSEFPPIMININNLEKMWDDNIFFTNNRQDTRIGRGVRSLLTSLGLKFADKEIEQFVNKWKATVDSINNIFSNFEIVSGDDIAEWYNYKNYYEQRGPLGESCMRMVNPEYFDIYCQNKNIQMVIFKSVDDQSKIVGRALLWTFDDGRKFMDRIYTNKDSDVDLFREYAKKIGAYAKYSNNSSINLRSFSPTGEIVELGTVNIQLTKTYHKFYPYVDTFKSYNPKTGIISNDDKLKGSIWMEDTDGGGGADCVWVEFYGQDIPLDDLIYCEYCEEGRWGPLEGYRYPDDCFHSGYYHIYVANDYAEEYGGKCIVTGEWRLTVDLRKVYSSDQYIIHNYKGEDYLYSEYHDEFIPKDIAVKVLVNNKSGSDWRAKKDGSWREVDGERYDKELLIDKELSGTKESFNWIKKFSEI